MVICGKLHPEEDLESKYSEFQKLVRQYNGSQKQVYDNHSEFWEYFEDFRWLDYISQIRQSWDFAEKILEASTLNFHAFMNILMWQIKNDLELRSVVLLVPDEEQKCFIVKKRAGQKISSYDIEDCVAFNRLKRLKELVKTGFIHSPRGVFDFYIAISGNSDGLRAILAIKSNGSNTRLTQYEIEILRIYAHKINLKAQRQKEKYVEAWIDSLSGCYNKGYLKKYESEFFVNAAAYIMVDIDNLKMINTQYGHFFADEVIKVIGTILIKSLRDRDIVCRWGGDEFKIIIMQINHDYPDKVLFHRMTYIKTKIAQKEFQPENGKTKNPFYASVSIGIAMKTNETQSILALSEEADKAVYRAKNKGKNCVSF